MTEDWELDFHNPPRIPPPEVTMVQCRHCKRYLPVGEAKKHTITDGKRQFDLYFCNQTHMEQWYIGQLQMLGF